MLYLIDSAVSFSTIVRLSNYISDQIRSSLTECAGIFLTANEVDDGGETLYQLAPPSIPFIGRVSQNLPFFDKLKRVVQHFKTQGKGTTPEESAVIVTLDRLLRQRRFNEIIGIEAQYGKHNPILANPQIHSLIGMAYCELGPAYREVAREHFKAAESVGFHDIKMMRRWYYLELMSGYGLAQAERICKVMVDDINLSLRYRSEFFSKLGYCFVSAANSTAYTDREKTILNLKTSIECYLDALLVGGSDAALNLSETLDWLEKPLWKLSNYCRDDVDVLFRFIETLAERRKDIHPSAVDVFVNVIMSVKAPKNSDERTVIRNLCNRTIGRVNKSVRNLSKFPGFTLLVDSLQRIRIQLEELDAETQ